MPVTYELIQSVTTSAQGSVSFTSIPQTYSDLEIRIFAGVARDADFDNTHFYFNADNASSTYSSQRTGQNSNTAQVAHSATDSFFQYLYLTAGTGAGDPPFFMSSAKIYIPEYTNTFLPHQTYFTLGAGAKFINGNSALLYSGLWNSTAAINTITFRTSSFSTINYKNGSMFSLYGILRA